MTHDTDSWRTQPMYTFGEAARLANVSTAMVKNWFSGYITRTGKEVPPLFSDSVGQNSMISFLRLIETVVAAQFRNADDARWHDVRATYRNARKVFGVEYPFAHINLISLGEYIIDRMNDAHNVGNPRAIDLPGHVVKIMHQVEYEGGLAAKWYPIGKECPIVIDPRIGSGVPTVSGTGVSVQAIRRRWKAGHKIDFIAQDLALETDEVEAALETLDSTERRPFTKFISHNGRISDSYRGLRL